MFCRRGCCAWHAGFLAVSRCLLSHGLPSRFWPICLLDLEPEAQTQHEIRTVLTVQCGDVDMPPDDTVEGVSMGASTSLVSSLSQGSDVSSEATGSEVSVASSWAACALQATETPPTAWPIVLRSNL